MVGHAYRKKIQVSFFYIPGICKSVSRFSFSFLSDVLKSSLVEISLQRVGFSSFHRVIRYMTSCLVQGECVLFLYNSAQRPPGRPFFGFTVVKLIVLIENIELRITVMPVVMKIGFVGADKVDLVEACFFLHQFLKPEKQISWRDKHQ